MPPPDSPAMTSGAPSPAAWGVEPVHVLLAADVDRAAAGRVSLMIEDGAVQRVGDLRFGIELFDDGSQVAQHPLAQFLRRGERLRDREAALADIVFQPGELLFLAGSSSVKPDCPAA